MNSKFKELRKLLQSSPIVPAPETFLRRDPRVSETPWIFEQLPSTKSAETRDALTSRRSPQVELHAEQVTDNGDGQIAVEEPKSVDQLGQSIAKLFQPAQLCKEHLAEIANATDSILKLARSAPEFFEPLKNFCDHVPRLSRSFASMRAFQDDFGVLAESGWASAAPRIGTETCDTISRVKDLMSLRPREDGVRRQAPQSGFRPRV